MNRLTRKALFTGLVLAGGLAISASTMAAQFVGTGVGAIPDSPGGTPPAFGTPLVVSFPVAGLTSNVSTVAVQINMTHTWVGDIDAVLAAPGGSPNLIVVSRIGTITATGVGDSSNFNGIYNFVDGTTGTDIWTVATNPACTSACDVAVGDYRTTAGGGAGQTNPPPLTSLIATFGGLTPAQANGTWTLTFRDAAGGDTGTVAAATLYVDEPLPVQLQEYSVD